MLTGKTFEATTMALSLLVLCGSYLIVVWKDRSWINWATPAFFFSLGGRYVFQFSYLYFVAPGGSHYAYFLCYMAYALPALIGALVYAVVKPMALKTPSLQMGEIRYLPWVLLAIGFLLYLPVLVVFRQYLDSPRRIYELTRTGYGVESYGSTTFLDLALITYLFKRNKVFVSELLFYTILGALTYMHGSKGLILNCFLIWVLYRVYVQRKVTRAITALGFLSVASVAVMGSFALFSDTADIADLLTSVTEFADYVRNGMEIVDDEHGKIYYGRINLENEVYGRIPRALMPGKPKDFGPFLLAKIYNPANYRADSGTGAVDFGEDYADFGPFAIVVRCFSSAAFSWFLSITVYHLRRWRSPPAFVLLLFFAGVSVIPISGLFLLPEYLLLAGMLGLLLRMRLVRRSIRYTELPSRTA